MGQRAAEELPAAVEGDAASLTRADNVVWAKLRGYPWWPGRVGAVAAHPARQALTRRVGDHL